MDFAFFLIGIALFVAFIFLMRLLGAWMLRINEVIGLMKEILAEVKKKNAA